MNRMHRDMGFSQPEWGASIHLDTQHVHVHITTVETGSPKAKRMKKVKEKKCPPNATKNEMVHR
jgi:hypothetical protein